MTCNASYPHALINKDVFIIILTFVIFSVPVYNNRVDKQTTTQSMSKRCPFHEDCTFTKETVSSVCAQISEVHFQQYSRLIYILLAAHLIAILNAPVNFVKHYMN